MILLLCFNHTFRDLSGQSRWLNATLRVPPQCGGGSAVCARSMSKWRSRWPWQPPFITAVMGRGKHFGLRALGTVRAGCAAVTQCFNLDEEETAAGERPTALVEPRGPSAKQLQPQFGRRCSVSRRSSAAAGRRMRTALLFCLQCSSSCSRGPFRKLLTSGCPLLSFRVLQPADVEQVIDVPVLYVDDPEEDPALEAAIEAVEALERIHMEQIELRVLNAVPVSAADREAWRRWVNRARRVEPWELLSAWGRR